MRRVRHCIAVALAILCASTQIGAQPAAQMQTIAVPMRDGATLPTDLYMPRDYSAARYPGGVPVILVITPYDRTREGPTGLWRDCFVGNGYAFAVQDMRGFHGGAEQGRGAPRQFDGYDTIEWLAAQPWCNGKVGMIGYSHPGSVQYETAVNAPPSLAAAIPAQAPGNYFTNSFYPPVFRKADLETIFRGRFTERTTQIINTRIRGHQDSRIADFNVPMLHSAGWFDHYTEGGIEIFRAIQEHGGPHARGNQKLLIGSWGHGVLQEQDPGQPLTLPGGMTFPPNSKPDWPREVWLPWFDHWLKGEATGVMDQPAVRYYLMGAMDTPNAPGNEWIEAADFPPPSSPMAFYAHADGTLATAAPAAAQAALSYDYDPTDPVPTVGRTHARIPVTGPYDQRPVEGRADVLTFTTDELSTPLRIAGQITARLWASSDRTDTDFIVRLTDVYPDGRSMIFADGVVRARYRKSFLQEELLTPGEVYEFEIDLGYIAIALAPGHRLRLAISSSSFDRIDINPNTGEPFGDHAVSRRLTLERLRSEPIPGAPTYTRTLVARNSIHMDRTHPSQVMLPILP